MKKEQLILTIKEALGLETKKEAEGFVKEINVMFEALANALEVGQKVKVGDYLVVEKAHVEAKSGVAMGKEYTTEARDVLKAKLTKAGKELA